MIVDALQKVGTGRSIVIDENDVVLAGNATIEAAGEAGITSLKVVEAKGSELVAVRRSGLSEAQKRDLALYDNRAAELAQWDVPQLLEDAENDLDLSSFFYDEELQAISSNAAADLVMEMSKEDEVLFPETDEETNGSGFMTFKCPLTIDQQLLVHKVLGKAKVAFGCSSTGKALAEVMTQWDAEHAKS